MGSGTSTHKLCNVKVVSVYNLLGTKEIGGGRILNIVTYREEYLYHTATPSFLQNSLIRTNLYVDTQAGE